MANRVVLGNRGGGSVGLYISKPGFNVLTTAAGNLLFSSDARALQIVQSGQVAVPNGGTASISYPNLGYVPTVAIIPHITGFNAVTDPYWAALYYHCLSPGATSATLYVSAEEGFTYAGVCTYAVLRVPHNG